MKRILGFLVTLLVLGTIQASAAAVDKIAASDVIKHKAVQLHALLIPEASPAVRSKISSSTAAARNYLAKCGTGCRLYAFLTADVKSRFKQPARKTSDLLVTLIFAEMLNTDSERKMLELNDLENDRQLLLGTISKMEQEENSTLMSVIDNLKP
jgi:hypothetical protein